MEVDSAISQNFTLKPITFFEFFEKKKLRQTGVLKFDDATFKVVCHKKQNIADANIFEENLKHIKIL